MAKKYDIPQSAIVRKLLRDLDTALARDPRVSSNAWRYVPDAHMVEGVIARANAARPFCALCLADVSGEPERTAPLGKNGAMVRICADCDTEPAREKRGPEMPYEIPEGASTKAIKAALGRELTRQHAPSFQKVGAMTRTKTPGWILVRVRRRNPNGTALDLYEAIATLRRMDWFSDLRVLGTTLHWHLFERPDARLTAAQRRGNENPLAWLRQFEVKTP